MSMIRQVRRGFFLILWFLFSAVRAWPARSLPNRASDAPRVREAIMLHLPSAGRDFRYGVGCLAGPAGTSCSSVISCRPSKETNDLKERSTMKSRTTATLLLANIHATAVERMSACAEKARGELISSQLAWALCNRRYDPGDIPPITVAALDCGGFHTGAVEVARTGFPPTGSHPNLRAAARGPRPPARVSDSHKPWFVRSSNCGRSVAAIALTRIGVGDLRGVFSWTTFP